MDTADLVSLKNRVGRYNEITENTHRYRKIWQDSLATLIKTTLTSICEACTIEGEIQEQIPFQNLSTIVLTLGTEASGISEQINDTMVRPLVKSNGALIYQQLFNGKVQVMISHPYIEGFGEPRQPRMIAIYRPEELKEPFFIRHVEEFIKDITEWEDYDDDIPTQIGFGNQIPTSKS